MSAIKAWLDRVPVWVWLITTAVNATAIVSHWLAHETGWAIIFAFTTLCAIDSARKKAQA